MPDLEALYREHRAGLVRLVERELHDHHDAEDVVQTAFLDAQRALERGTTPRNPRAWLAAIALNAARELRRRRVNFGALEDYAVQEASRLPEIKAALRSLPKNEQAAVVYRDLLGLSYAEMAVRMGATVPAVTMALHRGRSRLRNILGVAFPGAGCWRWLRSAAGHAEAAKATGAVLLAGGLATAGVVTAQRVGPAAEPPAARIATAMPQLGTKLGGSATRIDLLFRPRPRNRHHLPGRPHHALPGRGAPAQTAVHVPVPGPSPAGGSRPATSLPKLPSLPMPSATLTGTVATLAAPVLTTTVALPTGAGPTVPTPVADGDRKHSVRSERIGGSRPSSTTKGNAALRQRGGSETPARPLVQWRPRLSAEESSLHEEEAPTPRCGP